MADNQHITPVELNPELARDILFSLHLATVRARNEGEEEFTRNLAVKLLGAIKDAEERD